MANKQSVKSDIFELTVCYRVELSLPGTTRLVKSEKIGKDEKCLVQTDADSDEITVSKDILGSDEFSQIVAMDNVIRQFARSRALNAKNLKILSKGVYLIPVGLLEEVDKEVNLLIKKRHNLISSFISAYPSIIEYKKVQLKSLFDEKEFPDVSRLRQSFRENTYFFDFSVSGKIEKVNKELFKRESDKMKSMWHDAAQEIRQGLRVGFLELVKRASETLSVNEDGKKRRFHESTVDSIMEFLELFNKKNITNDEELTQLVQTAQNVLNNNSARDIFTKVKDENYRFNLQQHFQGICNQLEQLVDTSERMVEL